MVLVRNMLLREVETGVVYRLLDEVASTETPDNTSTHLVMIATEQETAMPLFWGKLKTIEKIADCELAVVAETREPINLEAMTEAESSRVERRWELLQALLVHGTQLYDPIFRGMKANELLKTGQASKPFFYATLRLFWQRGGGKSSLVTQYWKCGRRGERRVAAEGAPKPGRPRVIQPGTGVAATEFHRANMRVGWTRSPVGKDGRGLKAAYIWMLIARYPDYVALQVGEEPKVDIKNYDAIPTFEQFQYHWKTEHSFELRQLNRMQQRRFDLAFKPLLSGTLQEVRGPGTRFYIDATVLDVYCVSRRNRNRIVGRPTLYVVVDEFSRMIVGIYIGLEPPCWVGAMLALWNCNVDKVQFCAEYGIDIPSGIWPTGCMPVHLMGDRAELTSQQADALSSGFNLNVENARPYAGEAKGVGERCFGTLQAKFGPYLPGYVDKEFSGRGTEPAALRGAMDIHEITRVMISAVLHSNLRVVRDYEGWTEVIAAKVPFIPVSLWNWGVENLRCDSRKFDDAYLKRYLWPQHQVRFSRKALHFYRGLYYMGEELRQQPWYAKAFISRDKLETIYHPLHMQEITVLANGERVGAYTAGLTRRSKRFGDLAFSEVAALQLQQKVTNAEAYWENLPTQALLEKIVHDTSKSARKKAGEQRDNSLSKSGRLRDIRSNRADEIDAMTGEVLIASYAANSSGQGGNADAAALPHEETNTVSSVRALMQARRASPSASEHAPVHAPASVRLDPST